MYVGLSHVPICPPSKFSSLSIVLSSGHVSVKEPDVVSLNPLPSGGSVSSTCSPIKYCVFKVATVMLKGDNAVGVTVGGIASSAAAPSAISR